MATQPEIERLVKALNDDPDKLHDDYTPSVQQLIEIGESVLPAILPMMLSVDEMTRMRAQRVIEGVTMKQYGFRFGHGWRDGEGEDNWRRFWSSLGNLSFDDSLESRKSSVGQWDRWLMEGKSDLRD